MKETKKEKRILSADKKKEQQKYNKNNRQHQPVSFAQVGFWL